MEEEKNGNNISNFKKVGMFKHLERAAAIAANLPISVGYAHSQDACSGYASILGQMQVRVNHEVSHLLAMCMMGLPPNAEAWLRTLKYAIRFTESGAFTIPADLYTHLAVIYMQRYADIKKITRKLLGKADHFRDGPLMYSLTEDGLLHVQPIEDRPLKDGWDLLPIDQVSKLPDTAISYLDGVPPSVVQKLQGLGYNTTANFMTTDQSILQHELDEKEHTALRKGLWNLVLDHM